MRLWDGRSGISVDLANKVSCGLGGLGWGGGRSVPPEVDNFLTTDVQKKWTSLFESSVKTESNGRG